MILTSEICVRNVSVETEQVYMSGYTPSGFNEENVSRYIGNLCSVLGRISKFGMIDADLHLMAESSRFEEAFKSFIIKVKSGMTPHAFRSTSKNTI
ncbi:hypothetical protein SAMN04490185_3175 [Pseudomonas frederiksbergensis]|uniref:Uncharacterized protein n=2 Tax=Pseudomonas frederiksbergensis TaxID=104087 RepID=A0A1H4ZFJ3_9PSED|nr:hypothetical protein SAMN04490185_3175 [Pseudomonas frederiksbergensis]